jgi:5-methylcytosine-specific restriction enzyme A
MPRHPFYNSRVWKFTRRVKLTASPYCEVCKTNLATDVDHIIAINNGGDRTAMTNLRSLCHECHSRKTLYVDRMKRDRVPVKGCDINGKPLDPEHHWNKTGQDKGQGEISRPGASETRKEKRFAVSEAKDRARPAKQTYFEV